MSFVTPKAPPRVMHEELSPVGQYDKPITMHVKIEVLL